MLMVTYFPSQASFAKKTELTDVQAKLAIIYNFISRYAKWPGEYAVEQSQRVNICTLGNDPVTKEVALLEQASTQHMKVSVFQNIPLAKIAGCHVVYIATSERHHLHGILRNIGQAPVLSFSSIDQFTENGGMIALVQETERQGAFERSYIRYDVNAVNVHNAQLYVDPDALELARRVIR